jgi:hypothetical protein
MSEAATTTRREIIETPSSAAKSALRRQRMAATEKPYSFAHPISNRFALEGANRHGWALSLGKRWEKRVRLSACEQGEL